MPLTATLKHDPENKAEAARILEWYRSTISEEFRARVTVETVLREAMRMGLISLLDKAEPLRGLWQHGGQYNGWRVWKDTRDGWVVLEDPSVAMGHTTTGMRVDACDLHPDEPAKKAG